MRKIPLLLYSDSPSIQTGLGRICKDLAVLASSLPEFRIGSFGRGGFASSKLPFAQYCFDPSRQWGEEMIEDVWNDFAGNDPGIVFTIWDPSRLTWFSKPMMGGKLEAFLKSGRFARWGYFPVDAYGIGGKLTGQCAETVAAYDRVLAYTIYGSQILQQSIGRDVDWIPHGYNEKVFQPRDKAPGRAILNVGENDTVIGMVATNQARKDWGCAFETIAILRGKIPNLKFWCHTDTLDRYWNLQALMFDLGLSDITRITFTGQFSSEQLSYLYSTCNVSFLVSSEGYGFPLVESMACGVPVVHTTFGGGAELIPDSRWLVRDTAVRLDTQWSIYRPVFIPAEWAETIQNVLSQTQDGSLHDVCTNAVSHLQWKNLWPSAFKKWFLEGLR